jgi:hypothetical protein
MSKAKLKDLVEALEMQGLETSSYVNLKTGEVVTLTDEELTFGDDDTFLEDLPEWMVEARRLVKDVLHSGDYLALPDQWKLHEYRIISDFCWAQTDDEIRERLLEAIKGKGAFRRFKDRAYDLGVIDQWYEYRYARFEAFMVEWCKESGVDYE